MKLKPIQSASITEAWQCAYCGAIYYTEDAAYLCCGKKCLQGGTR